MEAMPQVSIGRRPMAPSGLARGYGTPEASGHTQPRRNGSTCADRRGRVDSVGRSGASGFSVIGLPRTRRGGAARAPPRPHCAWSWLLVRRGCHPLELLGGGVGGRLVLLDLRQHFLADDL